MAAKKRILVACGTAIATSTVVAKKIEELLKAKGIDVVVDQCKAAEASSKADMFDLIVTTTPIAGVTNRPSFDMRMGVSITWRRISSSSN